MDSTYLWALGIASLLVTAVFVPVARSFLKGAGSYAWERFRERFLDPPETPERERYYVTEQQFTNWTGERKKLYDSRLAEGYSFQCPVEERVPALESEGWEKMVLGDLELWWRSFAGKPYAYLMRKPE